MRAEFGMECEGKSTKKFQRKSETEETKKLRPRTTPFPENSILARLNSNNASLQD
jgi:hypothetical protein